MWLPGTLVIALSKPDDQGNQTADISLQDDMGNMLATLPQLSFLPGGSIEISQCAFGCSLDSQGSFQGSAGPAAANKTPPGPAPSRPAPSARPHPTSGKP